MVKVYAPASIGNVSVGFDVLGAAVSPIDGTLLGDCVSVEAAETFSLQNAGRFVSKLPAEPKENIVYQCWERFCQGDRPRSAGGDAVGKEHADRFGAGLQRLFGGRRADGDERILRSAAG